MDNEDNNNMTTSRVRELFTGDNFTMLLNAAMTYKVYWSNPETKPIESRLHCAICHYIYSEGMIRINDGTDCFTKASLIIRKRFAKLVEFGTRLPATTTALFIAWYELTVITGLSVAESCTLFDPLSVITHVLMNSCVDTMGIARPEHIKDILLLMGEIEYNGYHDADELENPVVVVGGKRGRRQGSKRKWSKTIGEDGSDDGDESDYNDDGGEDTLRDSTGKGTDIGMNILNNPTGVFVAEGNKNEQRCSKTLSPVTILRAECKRFVTNNSRGCTGVGMGKGKRKRASMICVGCLYQNEGDCSLKLNNARTPMDSRLLISQEWFMNNIEPYVSFMDFYSKEYFAAGQVGVGRKDRFGEDRYYSTKLVDVLTCEVERNHNINKRTNSLSGGGVEGERPATMGMSALNDMLCGDETVVETDSERAKRQLRYEQTSLYDELTTVLVNMIRFHTMVHAPSSDFAGGLLAVCNSIYKRCLWCDMTIFYELRTVLQDLVLRIRSLTKLVGSGIQGGTLAPNVNKPELSTGGYTTSINRSTLSQHQAKRITDLHAKMVSTLAESTNRIEAKGATDKKIHPVTMLEYISKGFSRYGALLCSTIGDIMSDSNKIHYSYNYDGERINYDALQTDIDGWFEKFPFMKTIRTVVNNMLTQREEGGTFVGELFQHLNTQVSCLCAFNTRTTALETDIYEMTTGRCQLPLFYNIIEILLCAGKCSDDMLGRYAAACKAHNYTVTLSASSMISARRTRMQQLHGNHNYKGRTVKTLEAIVNDITY